MEKDEIIVIHPARIKHSALVILSQSKDTFAASAKKIYLILTHSPQIYSDFSVQRA